MNMREFFDEVGEVFPITILDDHRCLIPNDKTVRRLFETRLKHRFAHFYHKDRILFQLPKKDGVLLSATVIITVE